MQSRPVWCLKNCGHIDAEHIEDAMAVGAYEAFEKLFLK